MAEARRANLRAWKPGGNLDRRGGAFGPEIFEAQARIGSGGETPPPGLLPDESRFRRIAAQHGGYPLIVHVLMPVERRQAGEVTTAPRAFVRDHDRMVTHG